MFRLFATSFLLAVSLAGSTAVAQEAPAPAPVPVSGLPVRGFPLAATDYRTGGITEQGRGTVSVPADRVRITIRAFGSAGSSNAASNDIEKQVVEIMRASGIPDARLLPTVFGGVNTPDSFTGTIAKPTREKIAQIEQKILAALPSSVLPLLRNVNVNGVLEADSCDAAIDRARSLAFEEARKRAEALATVAGIHLGQLQSATENEQTPGCGGLASQQYFTGNDFASYDSVDVSVSINATFGVRP